MTNHLIDHIEIRTEKDGIVTYQEKMFWTILKLAGYYGD